MIIIKRLIRFLLVEIGIEVFEFYFIFINTEAVDTSVEASGVLLDGAR